MLDILRRNRRQLIFWSLILFGCPSLVCGCFVPRATEEGVRQDVERDLPLGTPKSEVEAWLKKRGVPYSDGFVESLGTGQRTNHISAWMGHVGPVLELATWDIHLDFEFDEQGRLTKSWVNLRVICL